MPEYRLSPQPRSYTVFRAVVGSLVLAIGGAVGWLLWAWILPLVGVDLTAILSGLF